jgi:hypothetical protein
MNEEGKYLLSLLPHQEALGPLTLQSLAKVLNTQRTDGHITV